MEVDFTLLSQVLVWITCGGGAGTIAYFLMEKVRPLAELSAEGKRYTSLGLAAILAMAAFALGVFLGYEPYPINPQMWAEGLFAVAFVATSLSQVIHGRVKLRQ